MKLCQKASLAIEPHDKDAIVHLTVKHGFCLVKLGRLAAWKNELWNQMMVNVKQEKMIALRCLSWISTNDNGTKRVHFWQIKRYLAIYETDWIWALCSMFKGMDEFFHLAEPLFEDIIQSNIEDLNRYSAEARRKLNDDISTKFNETKNSLKITEFFKSKIIHANNI